MENANVQDTPQNANSQDTSNAFEAPQVDAPQGSSSELSVDDIILGNVDDSASAFGTPDTETDNTGEHTTGAKNDDTRYEYWQSQAAKKDNELEQLKQQQQQLLAMQQQQMQQAQQVQPDAQPAAQEFPSAPEKPKKPHGYSREEAYTDPRSESARYLDEVEEWRDNMEEYKDIKHRYDLAIIQERMDKEQAVRQEEIQRQQAYAQKKQQIAQVGELVQSKYGLTREEAGTFIRDMSSDQSLTMDNLVQLWRLKQGQGAPVAQPAQNAPSPAFQQTKRAQQMPSPMGVMPSTGTEAQGSTEDQVMDAMITDFNSKNPFK